MEKRIVLGALVELDLEATARWYAGAADWSCGCGDCLRFLEIAGSGQLPQAVAAVLADLGIPPRRATYVCMLYDQDGEGLYQFSYRVAGRILRQCAGEDWGSCTHEVYPYGAPEFPEPHFDLEFTAWLPLERHSSFRRNSGAAGT